MRGRSYSYSPPARSYGRRGRSPSPRHLYGGRSRDLPTSLLVRNLHRDCRPEDLRRPFGQFGPLKDIYLPRDYYTREPRGFGFIQYVDPVDAVEAKHQMDGQFLLGRELTVVFAEENRKKPADMRARDRIRGSSYDYRRSPRDSHSLRYSRSRSPRSHSPSPRRRRYSRSVSPRDRRHHRQRSYSGSPVGSRSRSPVEGCPSKASQRGRSYTPPGSRSRSRSPFEDYPRKRSRRERSASVSG